MEVRKFFCVGDTIALWSVVLALGGELLFFYFSMYFFRLNSSNLKFSFILFNVLCSR